MGVDGSRELVALTLARCGHENENGETMDQFNKGVTLLVLATSTLSVGVDLVQEVAFFLVWASRPVLISSRVIAAYTTPPSAPCCCWLEWCCGRCVGVCWVCLVIGCRR